MESATGRQRQKRWVDPDSHFSVVFGENHCLEELSSDRHLLLRKDGIFDFSTDLPSLRKSHFERKSVLRSKGLQWRDPFFLEDKRHDLVRQLRQEYKRRCQQAFLFPFPPKESLNRWIFERLCTIDILSRKMRQHCSVDCLIPSLRSSLRASMKFHDSSALSASVPFLREDGSLTLKDFDPVGPSMKREIMEDIPIKLKPPVRFVSTADTMRNHLKTYLRGTRQLMSPRHVDATFNRLLHSTRSIQKFDIDRMEDGLARLNTFITREAQALDLDSLRAYFIEMDGSVGRAVRSIWTPLVDAFCENMGRLCDEMAGDMLESMRKRCGDSSFDSIVPVSQAMFDVKWMREHWCGVAKEEMFDMFFVNVWDETDVSVGCRGKEHVTRLQNFQKLFLLFRLHWLEGVNNDRDPGGDPATKFDDEMQKTVWEDMKTCFVPSAWILLQRYESLLGGGWEGTGHQSAVPFRVLQLLHNEFGVSFECFASPFNCHFRNYCSAFSDIDRMFGSYGSFFDFAPIEGSFEANPPFSDDVMEQMTEHMNTLLAESEHPLSFCVIVPTWEDGVAFVALMRSPFQRGYVNFMPKDHIYVGGGQHIASSSDKWTRPAGMKRDRSSWNGDRTHGGAHVASSPSSSSFAAKSDGNAKMFRPPNGTHIFFLQNEAGYKKWTPTKDKMDRLAEVWKLCAEEDQHDKPPVPSFKRPKLAMDGPEKKG